MTVFVLLALSSCNDGGQSQKSKAEAMVKEWIGKNITIDPNLPFTIDASDTVKYNIDANYKMLMFVDSMGCLSCRLKLTEWERFNDYVDSIVGNHIPLIIIVQPSSINDLRHALRINGYERPIIVDINGKFNATNKIPSDMDYQTFLLDKDNKVVALGNPVNNRKIKDLYLRVLTGKTTERHSDPLTTVIISDSIVNYGIISRLHNEQRSVTIRNTGNKPLVIYDVVTSCGCTEVDYSKAPTVPNSETPIKISYKAYDKGVFSKTIRVYCNIKESPIKICIKGETK